MNDVTFKRMSPGESRIYYEGDHVGDVYRQAAVLHWTVSERRGLWGVCHGL